MRFWTQFPGTGETNSPFSSLVPSLNPVISDVGTRVPKKCSKLKEIQPRGNAPMVNPKRPLIRNIKFNFWIARVIPSVATLLFPNRLCKAKITKGAPGIQSSKARKVEFPDWHPPSRSFNSQSAEAKLLLLGTGCSSRDVLQDFHSK